MTRSLARALLVAPGPWWRLAAMAGLATLLIMLFYLGQQPVAAGLFRAPWDKLAHLAFYFNVGVLIAIASGGRSPWLVVAAVALLGIADEIVQRYTPGRFASFGDWAMDVCGALLALLFIRLVRAWVDGRHGTPARPRPRPSVA